MRVGVPALLRPACPRFRRAWGRWCEARPGGGGAHLLHSECALANPHNSRARARAGITVGTLQAAHDVMERTLSSGLAPSAFGMALLCAGQLSTFTGTISGQVRVWCTRSLCVPVFTARRLPLDWASLTLTPTPAPAPP